MTLPGLVGLTQQLTTLEASGLIRLAQAEPEMEYLFRHALVQDAAYASLLKADRKRLHQVVGDTLEQLYVEQAEELAPILGQHFAEAGDAERALKYFTLAGDKSARVYANAEAIAHYSQALTLAEGRPAAPWQHLYLSRGRALELNGQYAEALRNYAQMEALAQARGDQAMLLTALLARATIHSAPTAKYDAALGEDLSQQTLARASALGDRQAEAKSLWNLLLLNKFIGRYHLVLEYGERSAALARELGLKEQLAFTLNDMFPGYMNQGQPGRALAAMEEAQALWRELDNKPMLADSLSGLGSLMSFLGHFAQAIQLADEAYHLSQSIGNIWGQSYSLWEKGSVYVEQGEVALALDALARSVQFGEQAGFAVAQVAARAQLAQLYGELGDLERAFHLARLALTQGEAMPAWQSYPIGALASLYVQQGDLAAAEAILDRVSPVASEVFSQLALAPAQADLMLAQKNYAGVLALSEEMGAMLRQMGMQAFLPQTLAHQGRALLALGRFDEARTSLAEAHAVAQAIGSRYGLWVTLPLLAEAEARRGRAAEAQAYRAQARAVIDYIADHCPPDLRQPFLNRADVAAILKPAK